MKRCLYVFTFVLLIFSFNSSVKATFLQSRSIKTCSNGVTYGYYERKLKEAAKDFSDWIENGSYEGEEENKEEKGDKSDKNDTKEETKENTKEEI